MKEKRGEVGGEDRRKQRGRAVGGGKKNSEGV